MHHRILVVATTLLAMLCTLGVRADDCMPGEVLVQLTPHANILALNQRYSTHCMAQSAYGPSYRLCAPPGMDLTLLVSRLQKDPDVVSASLNLCHQALAVKNPKAGESKVQWVYGADHVGGLLAYQTDPSPTVVDYGPVSQQFTGSGVTVAVLDTGISLRNASLAAQVLPGWNFIDDNDNTDDSPGLIDSDGDGSFDDAAGHGTMVAGIVFRYAPNVSLLPVKVLDSDGVGNLWSVVEGIHYAIDNGANIINVSLGSYNRSDWLEQAVKDAQKNGILVVASVGNENISNKLYPAGFPQSLAVAALNDDKTKALFSNFGDYVDVDAPGVGIVSIYWDGGFAAWSGTSFAAPFVTAEAALIRSANPDIHLHRLRKRILKTSSSVNLFNLNFFDLLGQHGHGLIDMDAALSAYDDNSDDDDGDGN